MPLLNPATIRSLIDAQSRPGVDGAMLIIAFDNPPDFGRFI